MSHWDELRTKKELIKMREETLSNWRQALVEEGDHPYVDVMPSENQAAKDAVKKKAKKKKAEEEVEEKEEVKEEKEGRRYPNNPVKELVYRKKFKAREDAKKKEEEVKEGIELVGYVDYNKAKKRRDERKKDAELAAAKQPAKGDKRSKEEADERAWAKNVADAEKHVSKRLNLKKERKL